MSCVVSFGLGGADQGTLTTVLTMVTPATSESARPLSVVTCALPAVENVTPDWEMMVPTMVPPPAPLMVAALPTCQYTFCGFAPLVRMTLAGFAGAPTVSEVPIWKIQTELGSPPPSR